MCKQNKGNAAPIVCTPNVTRLYETIRQLEAGSLDVPEACERLRKIAYRLQRGS